MRLVILYESDVGVRDAIRRYERGELDFSVLIRTVERSGQWGEVLGLVRREFQDSPMDLEVWQRFRRVVEELGVIRDVGVNAVIGARRELFNISLFRTNSDAQLRVSSEVTYLLKQYAGLPRHAILGGGDVLRVYLGVDGGVVSFIMPVNYYLRADPFDSHSYDLLRLVVDRGGVEAVPVLWVEFLGDRAGVRVQRVVERQGPVRWVQAHGSGLTGVRSRRGGPSNWVLTKLDNLPDSLERVYRVSWGQFVPTERKINSAYLRACGDECVVVGYGASGVGGGLERRRRGGMDRWVSYTADTAMKSGVNFVSVHVGGKASVTRYNNDWYVTMATYDNAVVLYHLPDDWFDRKPFDDFVDNVLPNVPVSGW